MFLKWLEHHARASQRQNYIQNHLTWSRIFSARRSILKILPTTGAKLLSHSISYLLSNSIPSSMSMAENFAALKHAELIDCSPEILRCCSTASNDFSDPYSSAISFKLLCNTRATAVTIEALLTGLKQHTKITANKSHILMHYFKTETIVKTQSQPMMVGKKAVEYIQPWRRGNGVHDIRLHPELQKSNWWKGRWSPRPQYCVRVHLPALPPPQPVSAAWNPSLPCPSNL